MKEKQMNKERVIEKRPYHEPVLRVYGPVKLLTQSIGSANGDGGQNMMVASDRRIKEDIVRVGDHQLGIGLYWFDYMPEFRDAWGHGRQFGVMADEVETAMPQAVSVHPDGYKMVNYAMLGISRTLY